jgi:hypothetical protein
MGNSSCTATLTIKDEARVYECIERAENHTRHVFDLGLRGGRKEFELRAVSPTTATAVYARWLEI